MSDSTIDPELIRRGGLPPGAEPPKTARKRPPPAGVCRTLGCSREEHVRGLCRHHFNLDAPPKECIKRGCRRRQHAAGLCTHHWEEHVEEQRGPCCTREGCGRPAHVHGLCPPHYRGARRRRTLAPPTTQKQRRDAMLAKLDKMYT